VYKVLTLKIFRQLRYPAPKEYNPKFLQFRLTSLTPLESRYKHINNGAYNPPKKSITMMWPANKKYKIQGKINNPLVHKN
jgi:hypothetical protein